MEAGTDYPYSLTELVFRDLKTGTSMKCSEFLICRVWIFFSLKNRQGKIGVCSFAKEGNAM